MALFSHMARQHLVKHIRCSEWTDMKKYPKSARAAPSKKVKNPSSAIIRKQKEVAKLRESVRKY